MTGKRSDTGEYMVHSETEAAGVDAASVTYTPADASDWDGSADPGNQDDANDQLAARIKQAENDIAGLSAGGVPSSGWVALGQTLTYASADDPTYTATCAGVDLTSTLSVGMKLRVSQSTGGTKYFIITAIAFSTDTTITLYGGTDYDLANETISSPYFSVVRAPLGFPLNPAKWTVRVVDTTRRTQSNPTAIIWYNPGGVSITIPIGVWRVSYRADIYATYGSSGSYGVKSTLSTANNSESDSTWSMRCASTGIAAAFGAVYVEDYMTLVSKTTFYWNIQASNNGTSLNFLNDLSPGIIMAVCAYL